MSSTNRGSKRMSEDYYPTPDWCVHALLKKLGRLFGWDWLEPCAGDGAIIRAVTNFYRSNPGLDTPIRLDKPTVIPYKEPRWTAVELRSDAARQQMVLEPRVEWIQPQDFLTWETENRYDVVLTNPPFGLAMPFIIKSMKFADRVIMLLRLDFLGSLERAEFHKQHPADIYKLRRRPAFINGKTDSCEYAWFVWGDGGGRWFMLDD